MQPSPSEIDFVQSDDDARLLARLRAGDERAFMALVETHGPSMLRIAMTYVRSRSVAEEVVQQTWLGVLGGLERFQGRSSIKTWVFRILVNTAVTRARKEGRSVPFSSLAGEEDDEPAVAPERFLEPDHARWPGHWAAAPTAWDTVPDRRLLGRETLSHVARAIEGLPPRQAEVLVLRDLEGWSAEEVCEALELTEANQRVLLHRARSKVRRDLEAYFNPEEAK